MSRYAEFDPDIQGASPVKGWIDTVAFHYPNLPHESHLYKTTDAEWEGRMKGNWAVDESRTKLVPHTPIPPPMTLAQQAALLLRGIPIEYLHNSSLNGVYSTANMLWMTSIYSSVMAGHGLPNGKDSVDLPDVSGKMHEFTSHEFIELYLAIRDISHTLNTILYTNSGELPKLPHEI